LAERATHLTRAGHAADQATGAIVPPLQPSVTFAIADLDQALSPDATVLA